MKRTTKAIARLATLAVVAGGALSAPFAIGTASASTAVTLAPTNGAVTDTTTASAHGLGINPASVVLTETDSDALTVTVSGSAYFYSGPGVTTGAGQKSITCANPAACNGTFVIEDAFPETVTFSASDAVTPSDSASTPVEFNGIYFTTCGGVATPPGIQSGASAPNQCVSQLQIGTPVNETVKYVAGGNATQAGNQTLYAILSGSAAQFTTTQASNVTIVASSGNQRATCTTDTTTPGGCTFSIIDNTVADATGHVPTVLQVGTLGTPNGWASSDIGGDTDTSQTTFLLANVPTESINPNLNSVAVTRVDAIGGTVIAPTTQNNTGAAPQAEPGDVIQGQFQVNGACTPDATHTNCDNVAPFSTGTATPPVALAGVTVTVAVTKGGFITPNCLSPQSSSGTVSGTNNYANCTFNTTPAAGTKVGDLKSLGTTATVTTDANGQFTMSFAIGADPGFAANGNLPLDVTVNGLPTLLPGALSSGTTCTTPTPFVLTGAGITGGFSTTIGGPAHRGCPIDGGWTTNEQPLNGGTAKLVPLKALSSPNNVAILSENNFTPADSGTINVPDPDRVDFEVSLTDQFGNITSDAGASPAANAATLTKTGPGQLWNCGTGGLSSVSTCTAPASGPGAGEITDAQQADGTFKEVYAPAIGSYTNVAAQNPYQVDTAPNGGVPNTGYGTGGQIISVNDGTTTVTLSWTPPTTTFTSFTAGTPNTTTGYTTGNGPAQTDTYTLNFYNQLSQPVVTFSVKPGNTVGTSTAVTVAATVLDQNGNPIVVYGGPRDPVTVQTLRTGGNESSCVPQQNGFNGGPLLLTTNTSGVAAFTFSCNAPGLSTVSMVVQGPGGVQLAQGHEAVTFTGAAPSATVKEKPTVSLASHKRHHLTVTVHTHPALGHKKVNIYKVVNGLPHLIGALGTNAAGSGHVTITGLRSGHRYHIRVLVVNLGARYHSVFSKTKSRVVL